MRLLSRVGPAYSLMEWLKKATWAARIVSNQQISQTVAKIDLILKQPLSGESNNNNRK